ncbi:MAG: HipA domain-containing protein [Clostridiales bacterium]|jgi:hypothetical protein|nr:HipA domain-containing protein [Clostridiales bacterium]
MNYTLMHKNIEVAEIEIDSATGIVSAIGAVKNAEHFPIGTVVNYGKDSGTPRRDWFNEWWLGRSIPPSRIGIKNALADMGVYSSKLLLEKCKGLSLSDQYWIRPFGSNETWDEVNFFTNDFAKDVGEILFGHAPDNPNAINLMSPDNTSVGWHRKRWFIVEGKRFLLKGGEGVFRQEPFNEVIASEIMRRLGVSHIDYSIVSEGGKAYSICENFVSVDTELIPAYHIIESHRKNDNDSKLAHLIHSCEALGMPNVEQDICKMIVVDYIIANTDRHNTNYGFIRNAETLEWQGFAPIFDSGSSLWYDTADVGSEVDCMPFREKHDDQIKLVKDFTWFDFEALSGIKGFIADTFINSPNIDSARARAIAGAVYNRAAIVAELAKGRSLYEIKGRSFRVKTFTAPQKKEPQSISEYIQNVKERRESGETKLPKPPIKKKSHERD